MDYNRFMKRHENGYIEPICKNCPYDDKCDVGTHYCFQAIKEKLAEVETKIENGTLVELDESLIGEEIIGIHQFTDGTYQLDFDENIIIGFAINGVITWNNTHQFNDEFRNGMFFINNEKGKAEAEAKLRKLQGE